MSLSFLLSRYFGQAVYNTDNVHIGLLQLSDSRSTSLDVCHLNRWWRHLVNAYEVKAGMVFVAGKTV